MWGRWTSSTNAENKIIKKFSDKMSLEMSGDREMQAAWKTKIKLDKETKRHTDKETKRHTNKETKRQTDNQTNRKKGKELNYLYHFTTRNILTFICKSF